MKNNPTVDLQIKQPPSSPSLSPVVNNNSTTFSPHHDSFFNDQPQPSVENALTTDQYI